MGYDSSMGLMTLPTRTAKRVGQYLISLEHRAEKLYSALVTERRWFVILSAAVDDFWEKRLYYYTGHFTYAALLAVIAMMFALTAVVGILVRAYPSIQNDVRDAVKAFIPVIGGTPSSAVQSMMNNAAVVGVIGFLGLLWTGTKVFAALEYGFCQIWGCTKRSFVRRKVLGFSLIAAAGTIVIMSIVLQLGFAAVWGSLVGKTGFWYTTGIDVLRPLIGLAVNFALFAFIYQAIPPVKQKFKRSAVGAIISAAIFLGLQYVLAFYYGSISKVASVYGSLATVVVMVVWLHLTGMVIFLGAEIIHALYDEEMVEQYKKDARVEQFFKERAAARADTSWTVNDE
jgi:membrane protein